MKMLKFIKKPVVVILIIIIAGIIGIAVYFGGSQKTAYSFVAVQRGQVVQEISITGRVTAAQSVDLAFEKTGKVSNVYFDVGAKVEKGTTIVALENGDVAAQLRQAWASLEAEQANLSQLKKGTRPEELQAAQTKIDNAQRSLKNAEDNLASVQAKAESDLKDKYDAALAAAQKAVITGKGSLLTLSDIQYSHFSNTNQESINLANAKTLAVFALLGQDNAGFWTGEAISTLTGGAYAAIQNAIKNYSYSNIDEAVSATSDAIQKVKDALDVVPVNSSFTSAEKTNLSAEKSNINSEIVNLSSKQQAVAVQGATNNSNIISAQTGLDTAKNTLASAKDDLTLKEAGSTQEQIDAQEAKTESARANVENLQSQLAKTILKAPIDGIITEQDTKVGEIVPAQKTIVSMISDSEFEIEANVAEVDIAKIKLNDLAKVTLDAYGEDVIFQTKVSEIDPAETIIEGVPTYQIKLQFLNQDKRIKSGMTANVDVMAEQKENVLFVPYRAITAKDGDKFVSIKINSFQVEEKKVETGLKGSDGNIEIISGLKEGDQVVNFKEGQ